MNELRRICEESLADHDHTDLVLDFKDVSFVDHDGIQLIRHLGLRKVVVTNQSPFVAELLKEVVPSS